MTPETQSAVARLLGRLPAATPDLVELYVAADLEAYRRAQEAGRVAQDDALAGPSGIG